MRDPFGMAPSPTQNWHDGRNDAPGPKFLANFETTCPGCGTELEIGEPARMWEGQAHHDEAYCLDGWEPDPSWRMDTGDLQEETLRQERYPQD